VISNRPAHPALISEADFVAVQGIRAARPSEAGQQRTYLLAGLLRCGICGRHQQLAGRLRRAKISITCDQRNRHLSHEVT
jgi:site-specific DNA recombinase